jgi:hypothetical protein
MFVTPLLQGVRYKPYNMRCGRILLGRTEGGVTNITACAFVGVLHVAAGLPPIWRM